MTVQVALASLSGAFFRFRDSTGALGQGLVASAPARASRTPASRPPPDLEDLDFSAIKGEYAPTTGLGPPTSDIEGEGLIEKRALDREAVVKVDLGAGEECMIQRAVPPAVRREAMVVEDDPAIGRLIQFILEREGFDVNLVPDGRVASSQLGIGTPPAFVTLDLMLPYVNGYELLAMIRKTPGWAEVPVLMLSAKSREGDIVRALDGGANDYLTKPFQPAELKARIRRLMAQQ